MPQLVPGYDTQQLVVTVANDDTDINNQITTQAADQWLVSSLTLSGANMVILFTRTVAVESGSVESGAAT